MEFLEKEAASILYFLPLSILYYVMMSFTYMDKALKIIAKHLDNLIELDKVKKAVPHNVTTEMGMELLCIAKKLDILDEVPSLEQRDVRKTWMMQIKQ